MGFSIGDATACWQPIPTDMGLTVDTAGLIKSPEQIQQETQQQQMQQFATKSLADPRVAIAMGQAGSENPEGLVDAVKQITQPR